jgi:hypothetical protein
MKRFLYLLLLIALSLLPWTQPALAENSYPQKTLVRLSYPPSDANNILQLETRPDYTYLATGPLYTIEGFRYTWICPNEASLIDNACYAKSESGDGVILVNPSAAQIAFGYELDADSTTNEQLIYLADVSTNQTSTAEDLSLEGSNYCINPRQCLISVCANGTKVKPPIACPR